MLTMWLACAATLIAIFCAQEFLEGLFATGHPAGLAGIFGYGGWWAIPVSLVIGLVLAAVMHGALWVLREVAGRTARGRAVVQPRRAPAPLRLARAHARRAPLVIGWSLRGPPPAPLRVITPAVFTPVL